MSLARSFGKATHLISMHRKHFLYLILFDTPMTLTGEILVLVLRKSLTDGADRGSITFWNISQIDSSPKELCARFCETIARNNFLCSFVAPKGWPGLVEQMSTHHLEQFPQSKKEVSSPSNLRESLFKHVFEESRIGRESSIKYYRVLNKRVSGHSSLFFSVPEINPSDS